MDNFNMAYQSNVSLGSTSEVPGDLSALWSAMPLDQEHLSFPLFDSTFPGTTPTAFHSAPLSLSELPGADSPSTHDAWTSSTTNNSIYTTPDASTSTTPDVSTHTTPDVSAHPTPHISAHPAPPNLRRKPKLTRNGKPKPKEKELNPAEDIPTTAPSEMVACRWGTCTKEFLARDWIAHFRTGTHRAEMLATRNAGGSVDCLWAGCPARMQPTSVAKHVRSHHVCTYMVRCEHCGFKARGDTYVGAHGLARDCPMRPATPQLSPGTSDSDSASASTSAGPATPSEAGSSTSRRHARRYMPYDRSMASGCSLGTLDEDALHELERFMGSPWSCGQPHAEEAPPAPLVRLPVLSPRPIRPVRLDVFDRMLPDTYTPVVEADAVPAIAPAAMPLHPEPSAGGHESSALSCLSPEDVLIYSMVGGITCFDDSFVFNPDLTL